MLYLDGKITLYTVCLSVCL